MKNTLTRKARVRKISSLARLIHMMQFVGEQRESYFDFDPCCDIRAKRTQIGRDEIITINHGSTEINHEVVRLDAGSTIATVELADDSSLSFAIDETNFSTGAAFRQMQAVEARQRLIHVKSRRCQSKCAVKKLQAANDLFWRRAA